MKGERRAGAAVLPYKAESLIEREGLLPKDAAVLVALSGGADSMALLSFFREYRDRFSGIALAAAHLNHCLRGEESERDEAFVRSVCSRWKIPLTAERADVAALAAERSEGVEAAGRRVRYAFLERTALSMTQAEGRPVRIATAHTLSDQWETILLHLTRGCGLRGLCGIPISRGRIIRPLLNCSRGEVEDYCRARDIPFIIDSSNADERYARNRLRNGVIPLLREINPRGAEAAGRAARLLRRDEEYLEQQAASALAVARCGGSGNAYDAAALYALPPALRSRALRRLAGRSGEEESLLDLDAAAEDRLEALLASGSGGVNLPGGRVVYLAGGLLSVREPVALFGEVSLPLAPNASCEFCGRQVTARLLPRSVLDRLAESASDFASNRSELQKIYKFVLQNTCDYDMIKNHIVLRNRRAGDAFRPAGRGMTKSLKKLWNEKRLPPEKRDAVPLLCDEEGICLVAGFGCDERVRITDATRRILLLLDSEAAENPGIDASFFEGIGET